jgi:cytochrome c553
MKLLYTLAAATLALAMVKPALAGDVAAGEKAFSAKACIGCHGPAGKSANPDMYPALAGKDAAFLIEQLNAFRSGERNNPLMTPMAAGLSDADIADIAAYLAAQK